VTRGFVGVREVERLEEEDRHEDLQYVARFVVLADWGGPRWSPKRK
jgi:hypothetical protein